MLMQHSLIRFAAALGAVISTSALASREAHAATTVNVSTVAQLESAVANAAAGTTIVLANGTYTLRWPLLSAAGGTAAARIIVRAATSQGAVIVTNGHEEAFRINHPYWSFENLFIRVNRNSTYGYKLEGNGKYARITGNTIQIYPGSEAGIKGAGGGLNPPYPDYAYIASNRIYMTSPTTYGLAEGIDAVGVLGWTVTNNIVHGIKTAAGGVAYGIMLKGNSQNSIVERNLVYDCFIGLSFGGGGSARQWMRAGDATYEHRGGYMRNNVVMNSKDVAIYLYASNNARVYNNTLYNSFTTCGTGCSAIDVRMQGATADIRNNILDKRINNREGGTHTAAYNKTLPSPTSTTWFVNVAARDMRLKSTAPAVNAAQVLTAVPRDKVNLLRGTTPDVGAHELQ